MADNTSPMRAKLHAALNAIGLQETEIKVFSFLLAEGAALKATVISKRTGVNRTTLYGVLNSLIERGFVATSNERGVARFQSMDPRTLPTVIEQMKAKFSSYADDVSSILPVLVSARNAQAAYFPKVSFFEGVAGIKQVYDDALENNPGGAEYGFINVDTVVGILGEDWAHTHIQKRKHNKIFSHTIAMDTAEARKYGTRDTAHLRKTRYMPQQYAFDLEVITYGDKTALMSYDRERPVAVLIEDRKVAEAIRKLFNFVNDSLATSKQAGV